MVCWTLRNWLPSTNFLVLSSHQHTWNMKNATIKVARLKALKSFFSRREALFVKAKTQITYMRGQAPHRVMRRSKAVAPESFSNGWKFASNLNLPSPLKKCLTQCMRQSLHIWCGKIVRHLRLERSIPKSFTKLSLPPLQVMASAVTLDIHAHFVRGVQFTTGYVNSSVFGGIEMCRHGSGHAIYQMLAIYTTIIQYRCLRKGLTSLSIAPIQLLRAVPNFVNVWRPHRGCMYSRVPI